jgi:hypothetical protein
MHDGRLSEETVFSFFLISYQRKHNSAYGPKSVSSSSYVLFQEYQSFVFKAGMFTTNVFYKILKSRDNLPTAPVTDSITLFTLHNDRIFYQEAFVY